MSIVWECGAQEGIYSGLRFVLQGSTTSWMRVSITYPTNTPQRIPYSFLRLRRKQADATLVWQPCWLCSSDSVRPSHQASLARAWATRAMAMRFSLPSRFDRVTASFALAKTSRQDPKGHPRRGQAEEVRLTLGGRRNASFFCTEERPGPSFMETT